MIALLRDPAWQIVGILFGAAAVVVSVIIYKLQRSKKELTYIVSHYELFSMKERPIEGVTLLCGGEERRDLWMVIVTIQNTGSAPLLPAEFDRPISISLGDSSPLVSAKISSAEPPELHVGLSISGDTVQLERVLMNPGDAFSIQLLASEVRPDDTRLDYRISGIKQMVQKRAKSWYAGTQRMARVSFVLASTVIFVALVSSAIRLRALSGQEAMEVFPVAVAGVYVYGLFWVVLRRARLVSFKWPWGSRG